MNQFMNYAEQISGKEDCQLTTCTDSGRPSPGQRSMSEIDTLLNGSVQIEAVVDQLRSCRDEFVEFSDILMLFSESKAIIYVSKDRFAESPRKFQKLLTEDLKFEIVERRDNWMVIRGEQSLALSLSFAASELLKELRDAHDRQEANQQKVETDFERAKREAFDSLQAYRNSKKFKPRPVYDEKFAAQRKQQALSKPDRRKARLDSLMKDKGPCYEQGKAITMNDIENSAKFENRKLLGRRCFELTNDFRQTHGLNKLTWNEDIFYVSLTHSEDMSLSKVSFGHTGFADRLKMFPFSYQTASENVAYCEGSDIESLASTIVNGWINSPGHRKNMLSNANISAVAAYSKEGSSRYYFTQMFALQN